MAQIGLSVLIPVYNFSIIKLISDLKYQLEKTAIDFEIRIYDDASSSEFKNLNQIVSQMSGITYNELSQNLGRSKIRNLLAKDAKFENLLFLDCDNEIFSESYIALYLELINDFQVLVGGRVYYDSKPKDSNFQLHWLAGKNREEKEAIKRNISPFNSFMLDNMLIKRPIFLTIQLDESIKTYGHEDTKFGFELERKGIKVLHVDNPTYHIGLSTSEDFLLKTELAVKVLYRLVEKDGIGKSTNLYSVYFILNKLKIDGLVLYILKTFEKHILKNLKSSEPELFIFDLFKLMKFIELNKVENRKQKWQPN